MRKTSNFFFEDDKQVTDERSEDAIDIKSFIWTTAAKLKKNSTPRARLIRFWPGNTTRTAIIRWGGDGMAEASHLEPPQ